MNPCRATIDIGSNSVLLLVAEVSPFRELAKHSEVTALGKGLDRTGVFSDASLALTFEALKKYVNICQRHGIAAAEIIATATEASRVAKNAADFYQKVDLELGVKVRIITGLAEAALTTKGILFNTSFATDQVVVMDIGGASTEFIRVDTRNMKILESVSLKAGAVRATDWLSENRFNEALESVFEANKNVLPHFKTNVLHCVAGTLTSLGNMYLGNKEFVEDEVHGMRLSTNEISKLRERCGEWSPERFAQEFPFLGKRSEAMRGGLLLTAKLLEKFGVTEVVISTYGLRYGTFLEGGVPNEYLA
jgi:exopolyphosphatase/guanosine-5'-triphosphate,3'-diphosphate pyrophosphatase